VGLGTYLGRHDAATDALYRVAAVRAAEMGTNLFDAAVNYRCQRSERTLGEAIRALATQGIPREQLVIATKAGFIPFDNAPPEDPGAYLETTFLRPGVMKRSDVVAECHCLAPAYLRHQLETSLANLGVDCIDIYYLHNPETQLSEVPPEEFLLRMQAAFEALESFAAEGRIQFYGTATWTGYRRNPEAKDYLCLSELVGLARKIAGERHRFRFVQMPLNLAMTEAFTLRNQSIEGVACTPLEAAKALGLAVIASASIQQSRLARGLPAFVHAAFPGLESDAQRALQFTRSTPWLTTALVGMKELAHVEENLALARTPPAPLSDYLRLFQV
jgi:aryl-alcohol dehydrogenase-like predicted oxidoreductase